jgi:hypothetical protein
MAPSPSASPNKPLGDERELIAAANAVFGALELIAETPCRQETQRHVRAATDAANAKLEELGLTREDLLDPRIRRQQAREVGGRRGPDPGPVIDMAARRSEQSR